VEQDKWSASARRPWFTRGRAIVLASVLAVVLLVVVGAVVSGSKPEQRKSASTHDGKPPRSTKPESTEGSANSLVSPQLSRPFEAGWRFT